MWIYVRACVAPRNEQANGFNLVHTLAEFLSYSLSLSLFRWVVVRTSLPSRFASVSDSFYFSRTISLSAPLRVCVSKIARLAFLSHGFPYKRGNAVSFSGQSDVADTLTSTSVLAHGVFERVLRDAEIHSELNPESRTNLVFFPRVLFRTIFKYVIRELSELCVSRVFGYSLILSKYYLRERYAIM